MRIHLYDVDAAYVYDHLRPADRYLVTLDATNHRNVLDTPLINYYETAFFGYYIQGKTDYGQYLMPDSAKAIPRASLTAEVGVQQ